MDDAITSGQAARTDGGRVDASDRGVAQRGLAVLATVDSRRLLATRLTGQASDGLLQAALGTFVLFSPERQSTAAQVAGAFALLLLPYSLLGPFTGVFLDRWSRARTLVVANVARSAVTLVIAAMVASIRQLARGTYSSSSSDVWVQPLPPKATTRFAMRTNRVGDSRM